MYRYRINVFIAVHILVKHLRINCCKQKYFFYKKAKIRDELLSLLCSLAQMCLGHIYVQMYKTYFPETYDGILYHLYMYMYVVIVDNLIDSVNWPKFRWIWPKCHALVSLILLFTLFLEEMTFICQWISLSWWPLCHVWFTCRSIYTLKWYSILQHF